MRVVKAVVVGIPVLATEENASVVGVHDSNTSTERSTKTDDCGFISLVSRINNISIRDYENEVEIKD